MLLDLQLDARSWDYFLPVVQRNHNHPHGVHATASVRARPRPRYDILTVMALSTNPRKPHRSSSLCSTAPGARRKSTPTTSQRRNQSHRWARTQWVQQIAWVRQAFLRRCALRIHIL
jgi:hypothetical protein